MSIFDQAINKMNEVIKPLEKPLSDLSDKVDQRIEALDKLFSEKRPPFKNIAGKGVISDIQSSAVLAEKIEGLSAYYADGIYSKDAAADNGYSTYRADVFPIFRNILSDVASEVNASALYLPTKQFNAQDIEQIITHVFNAKSNDKASYVDKIKEASQSASYPSMAVQLEVHRLYEKIADIFVMVAVQPEKEQTSFVKNVSEFLNRSFTARINNEQLSSPESKGVLSSYLRELSDIKLKNAQDSSIFPKGSDTFAFVAAVKNVEGAFLNALADKVDATTSTYERNNGKKVERSSPIDAPKYSAMIRETFEVEFKPGVNFKDAFRSVSGMVGSNESAKELGASVKSDAIVNFNRAMETNIEKMKSESQQNSK